jgi:hypothetical protein
MPIGVMALVRAAEPMEMGDSLFREGREYIPLEIHGRIAVVSY